jgi:hypothetical protein
MDAFSGNYKKQVQILYFENWYQTADIPVRITSETVEALTVISWLQLDERLYS